MTNRRLATKTKFFVCLAEGRAATRDSGALQWSDINYLHPETPGRRFGSSAAGLPGAGHQRSPHRTAQRQRKWNGNVHQTQSLPRNPTPHLRQPAFMNENFHWLNFTIFYDCHRQTFLSTLSATPSTWIMSFGGWSAKVSWQDCCFIFLWTLLVKKLLFETRVSTCNFFPLICWFSLSYHDPFNKIV